MKKIIILLLVLFITGCGSSNKFIGTWYHYNGDSMVIITFSDGNKCSIEELDEETKCTYKYDDKKVFMSSVKFDLDLDYSFTNNYLLISNTKFYKDMKDAKDNFNKEKQEKDEVILPSKNIKVPSVTGKTLEEAKKEFKAAGLALNIIYEENDFYDSGKVIRTSPAAGRMVDKNTVVDVFVSSGFKKYIIEDYTGKNYIEVKTELEITYKMQVIIEKKNTIEEYDSNKIIGQSIAPGTEVDISESNPTTIVLYIPNQQ